MIQPPAQTVVKTTVTVVAAIREMHLSGDQEPISAATYLIKFEPEEGAPVVLEFGREQIRALGRAVRDAISRGRRWEAER